MTPPHSPRVVLTERAMTNPDIAKAVERLEAYVEYLESDSFRLDMEPDDALSLAEEIRAILADHARLTKLVSSLLEADRGQGREGWLPIEEAPRDGTRIILAWKEVPGLAQHNELGRWRNGWANTYGQPFHGDPDYWWPLPPAPLPAQREGEG